MRKKRIVVLSSVLAIIAVAVVFFVIGTKKKPIEQESEPIGEEASFESITYNGKKYRYNTDLKTILFMGVDTTDEVSLQQYAGRGGQTDTLLLLLLDTKEHTTKILQISRDTMVDIDVYDMDGNKVAVEKAQIATQYAYGDGEKKSCLFTKEAISQLLYGIPVQSYVSINLDGIAPLVDAVGGISLQIPKDYTMIDPVFEKGKTVQLTGKMAHQYVRYRDTSKTGSNEGRMERQSQVMEALITQFSQMSEELFQKLFQTASPYMVTDLTVGEGEKLLDYEVDTNFERVPGKVQEGEKHDEFYIDEKKLYDLIVKLFYKEI